MAHMLAQLGPERRFDHASGQLRQQPTRTRDLLRRKALQRILQRLLGQQAREAIHDVSRRTLSPSRPIDLSPDRS
jgi:hypothetical protein